MANPKKPLDATITTIAAPAPAAPEIATPIYNRENLDHVLGRLRALVHDVRECSGDLAAHHQKHSRVHHVNGQPGPPLEAPVAHEPQMAALLQLLQASIGEFVHSVGSRL